MTQNSSAAPTVTPSLIALGLAFLFTGLGYALPVQLFPPDLNFGWNRANEILNLFCLVAWMGLSHFVFAYKGHLLASRRQGKLALYLGVFATSLAVLFVLRTVLAYSLFSAVAWVYFISHLLRAEMYFAGHKDWRHFVLPLAAFTYFSLVMLAPEAWINSFSLFAGALLALSPLLFGGRCLLKNEFYKPLFLIAMFLIGESLLWGKYRPYMTAEFRDGVYTVHVALASFYHYFKSYAHMMIRGQGSLGQILLVNLAVIGLGIVTLFFFGTTPLIYVFGVQFFTLWVWQHQQMSDWFNWQK